jgi:hypothetical protein
MIWTVPTIIRQLPYFDHRTPILVQGQAEEIKPAQIIVWVSISDVGDERLDPSTPRFPAVLDTGLSHNFAIKEDLLDRWARRDRRSFPKLREITIGGHVVPLHEAEVWLHPNLPRQRDSFADRAPFPMQLESGVAIYPRELTIAPRLPLIGLRALQWSKLHLAIDCEHCRVSIRTARRLYFFP